MWVQAYNEGCSIATDYWTEERQTDRQTNTHQQVDEKTDTENNGLFIEETGKPAPEDKPFWISLMALDGSALW